MGKLIRRLGLWLGVGASALVFAGVLAAALILLAMRGALPDWDGTVAVPKAGAPVEIVRDDYGIPHIYGESLDDALYGLGFVHAQDRMWQMELYRRVAQGRVAELAGGLAVPVDTVLRALNLDRWARESLVAMTAETRAALQAYTDGVNAAITSTDRPLAAEFVLLRHEPEPWAPEHSVMLLNLLGLSLGGNAGNELARVQAIAALPLIKAQDLFPPFPGEPALPWPDEIVRLFSTAVPDAAPMPLTSGMSNNWVVDAERSATGAPLLANDPHLGMSAPSIWYLAHLSYPDPDVPEEARDEAVPRRNAVGGTMAGIPAVLLGRTDFLAWGFTTTGADVQDFFVEKLNPADPDQYLAPEGYRDFDVREDTIKVRFGEEVPLTLRATRHGPVVPDGVPLVGDLVPDGHVLALQWTGLSPDNTTLQAALGILAARNWDEAAEALKDYKTPVQSMVFADTEGTIAFIAPGAIPVRHPQNDAAGRFPVPGWNAIYDWQGLLPFADLPQSVNPETGRLASANSKITEPGYPHFITADWQAPFRRRRIDALLNGQEAFTLEDFVRLQMDAVSPFALEMLPLLLATAPESPQAKEALTLLAGWDGTMDPDSASPLIFTAWTRQLWRHLTEDETADGSVPGGFNPVVLLEILREEKEAAASPWCDDQSSAQLETCAQTLSLSLEATIAQLTAAHGKRLQGWRWGEAHASAHGHLPLSNIPLLNSLFDIPMPGLPGGPYTVRRGGISGGGARPFARVHGAGLRTLYDMGDLENARYVISTGQAGHPMSPHYDDLAPIWAAGDFITIPTKRQDVEAAAAYRLVLQPSEGAPGGLPSVSPTAPSAPPSE